jgi:AcrR family transcriptional regulator
MQMTADRGRPSRRERPAKPALTREGIVAAALRIMAKDGLSKVTMRRVAATLDTGAASLYVYVRNTEDLHAQILDVLLDSVPRPTDGDWRERLTDLLSSYVRVLLDHHEIARMTMTTHPSGPNYLALVNTMLGLLSEGGVPDRESAWAVDLLLAFATATAVEHGTPEPSGTATADFAGLAVESAVVNDDLYPHIARLGAELLSGAGEERFRWGLDVLINGALHTPRTNAPSTTQSTAQSTAQDSVRSTAEME